MTATPGTTGTDGAPAASGDVEIGVETSREPGPARPRRRGVLVFMLVAGAVVLLLVGATAGLALSGRLLGSADATTPDNASVDAGFARDMIVHHDQGVLMAHYAEKNTTDPEIDVMAYDIGYTQTDQIGQMQGWLSLWDLPESGDGTHMGWMGAAVDSHGMTMGASTAASAASGAAASSGTAAAEVPLMPGMATASEIAKLQGLTGAASDTYFLQLMVRHHQGGAPMMQYAAEHATSPVVRNFASKMAQSQSSEISVMTQMLAERGAQPLPAPAG
jgi:uncharacterized protein (DUF305 family)